MAGRDEDFRDILRGFSTDDALDLKKFMETLRQAAWLRAGATSLGSAVGDYRRALVEGGVSEDDATMLTAKLIEDTVKSLAASVPQIITAVTQAAATYEALRSPSKEKGVPGERR